MSDAYAQIFTPAGELLGYSSYQGSASTLRPLILPEFAWPEDVDGYAWPEPCEHELEDAIAYSDYGGGDHWPVRICRRCQRIDGPLSQYSPDWGYSPPDPEWTDPVVTEGHPFPELARCDLVGAIA